MDAARPPDHRNRRRGARHAQQALRQHRRGRSGVAVPVRAAVPLRPDRRLRARRGDDRSDAAERRDRGGRQDDHAAHPPAHDLVGRRTVRRARSRLHLEGGDEPAQQHPADQRLGRHRRDGSARSSTPSSSTSNNRTAASWDLRGRRRRVSAAARAPARNAFPISTMRRSTRKPISSGPFVLTAWNHGSSLEFAANPRYWRGKPGLDRITLPRRAQRRHALQRAANARGRRIRQRQREPDRAPAGAARVHRLQTI